MAGLLADGFVAVPIDHSKLLNPKDAGEKPPRSLTSEAFKLPESQVASTTVQYAKEHLSQETFNHSMRVYCYGLAILPYLAEEFQSLSHETWLLSCLLHDIGTTDHNLRDTRMSFEFHGGMIAHSALLAMSSPRQQAEAVAESIIRHQDVGSSGNITALGGLLQLATILDNLGRNSEFLHPATIETIIGMYPRMKWSGCFASVIREEGKLKPWAHTTKMGIEEFAGGVLGNDVMNQYD